MAGARIEIDVLAQRLQRVVKEVRRRCMDLRPAWSEAGEHMLRSIDKNFEGGGRPRRWRPWSAATLESRMGGRRKTYTKKGQLRAGARRKLVSRKILTQSGRLRRRITKRADRRRLLVGSNAVYAAIHQLGGKAGRGRKVTIPARPYLVVQAEDWAAIAGIIERHVAGAL